MKTYREFYGELSKYSSSSPFRSAHSSKTDELLREQGINVYESDSVALSQDALFVYFAMKIRELEERIDKLEK